MYGRMYMCNLQLMNAEWFWDALVPWVTRSVTGYAAGWHVGASGSSRKLEEVLDRALSRALWLSGVASTHLHLCATWGMYARLELPPAMGGQLRLQDVARPSGPLPPGGVAARPASSGRGC